MFERFNLRENPFRTVPSLGKDVVWAGFHDTENKIKQRINKSIRIPNSSIVLNWGEYGSGKTHAARYFSKENVLHDLCSSKPVPLSIVINLPKGKNVVWDLYTSILDKLKFHDIYDKLHSFDNIHSAIESVTDNEFIKKVLYSFYKANDQQTEVNNHIDDIVNFLYGNGNAKQREAFGLPRNISSNNDCIELLSAFFSLITSDLQKGYSCVILWIDEFEDVTMQTAANVTAVNSFIRGMIDKAPSNLLMFINFTQSAFANVSDLSAYLQEAVRSRVKERIEFSLPNQVQFLEYLIELLGFYRLKKGENDIKPFKQDMICQLISDLDNPSIRRFNEALSYLLEIADLDEKDTIDMALYNENKSDIIGWK